MLRYSLLRILVFLFFLLGFDLLTRYRVTRRIAA